MNLISIDNISINKILKSNILKKLFKKGIVNNQIKIINYK